MKLALITDTHAGVRNDAPVFIENDKRFFDMVFFPTLKQRGITTVVHLGDIVDRRKYINFKSLSCLRKDFVEPLCRDYDFHLILGNHDIFNREDMCISIATEILDKYDLTYYEDPAEVVFNGTKILFVPWICDGNRDKTVDLLNSTDAKIVFGHLELAGFPMFRGVFNHDGDDPAIYQKFEMVCTGHFHHRSSRANIHYLGSHSQFTWTDFGDARGFHIFDTDTRELEFICNPYDLFAKVHYDDADGGQFDPAAITGKYVKVIVRERNNQIKYDHFLSRVEAAKPIEFQIVEDHLNLDKVSDDLIISDTKDTLTIMRDYAKAVNATVDHSKLDTLFVDLYNQALAME
jgi:DNA repair exonuclease SbcCD nuclease subunit